MQIHWNRATTLMVTLCLAALLCVHQPAIAQNRGGFGGNNQGPPSGNQGGGGGKRSITIMRANTTALATTRQVAFPPATIPSPDEYPSIQSNAITTRLDVSYRRAFLGEVIGDLARRAGLRADYPLSIERSFMVSLELQNATVKEILTKVATLGKLKLDFQTDQTLISQPADETTLNSLQAQLKDKDRWVRCTAAADLAALGDERVASILSSVVSDPDIGVVAWAMLGLRNHESFLPALNAERKTALIDYLFGQIAHFDFAKQSTGHLSPDLAVDMEILAALKNDRAQLAIADFVRDASDYQIRCAAAMCLVDSGYPDAFKVLAEVYSTTREAVDKKSEGREKEGLITIDSDDPELADQYFLTALHSALVQCPTAQAAKLIANPPSNMWFVGLPQFSSHQMRTSWGGRMRGLINMEIALRLTPSQIEKYRAYISIASDKPVHSPAANVGVAATTGVTTSESRAVATDEFNIAHALNALSYVDNAGINDGVEKIARNLPRIDQMAVFSQSANYRIGAYSKGIIDALNDSLEHAQKLPTKIYILNSLGTSHLPEAAEILIRNLQDADPLVRAAAARALAHTRDERAVKALVECLKLPSSKVAWPDLEKEASDNLQAGKAVRPVTNPRKTVAFAIADTRDPKALDALLAIYEDKIVDLEAREAAMAALASTALDRVTVESFLQHVQKMTAPDQRLALRLKNQSNWTRLIRSNTDCELLWLDARIISLVYDHALDRDTMLVANDKTLGSLVTVRLAAAGSPRAELALYKLSEIKDEEDVAKLAGRDFEQYGDPSINVKLDR